MIQFLQSWALPDVLYIMHFKIIECLIYYIYSTSFTNF